MLLKMRTNKKGFTLAEVIVAMTIIAIAGAAFFQVYYAGRKAGVSSQQRLDALVLAQNELEECRKSLTSTTIPGGTINRPTETLNNTSYDITVNISNESSSTEAAVYTITVKVVPQDGNARPVLLGTKFFVGAEGP